jgi:RNA recognition motif-containing protein
MSTRLFVGNLPFETSELDLRDLFGQSGQIIEVKVVTDRETGRSRGFAFVEMSNAEEANKAISELNGRDLGGRTLKVNEAEARAPRAKQSAGGGRRW